MKQTPSYNDSILDGITFDDLITTIQSNEQTIDEATVTRVYNEIPQAQLRDAMFILQKNMKFILKECER